MRELPGQWINRVRYGNELGPTQERHTALLRQSVERYKAFYQLPDYITDKARNVDVHIVTRRQLRAFTGRVLSEDYKRLRNRYGFGSKITSDINIQLEKEKNERAYGVVYEFRNRKVILISQEHEERIGESIDHETLHVLSDRPLDQGTGFLSGIDFFYPGEPYEGFTINETTTEVLRLVAANPGLSISQLNDLVKEGKTSFGYNDTVSILLKLLAAAQGNNEAPFDIRAQAPLYFGFDNIRAVDARRQFIAHLEGSLSDEDRRILRQKIHQESSDLPYAS